MVKETQSVNKEERGRVQTASRYLMILRTFSSPVPLEPWEEEMEGGDREGCGGDEGGLGVNILATT